MSRFSNIFHVMDQVVKDNFSSRGIGLLMFSDTKESCFSECNITIQILFLPLIDAAVNKISKLRKKRLLLKMCFVNS